jgi:hypothetical protein
LDNGFSLSYNSAHSILPIGIASKRSNGGGRGGVTSEHRPCIDPLDSDGWLLQGGMQSDLLAHQRAMQRLYMHAYPSCLAIAVDYHF